MIPDFSVVLLTVASGAGYGMLVWLGVLSALLDLPEAQWLAAIRGNLPEKLHDMNLKAFQKGREAGAGLRQ